MLKKCKVVILPTNEKATMIGKYFDTGNLVFNNPNHIDLPRGFCQHLYILSDEEIKEGDWGVGFAEGINGYERGYFIFKHDGTTLGKLNALCNGSKRIIATTDSSLKITVQHDSDGFLNIPLPKPSEAFIKVFIEEYNKGNIITDVMVEYEKYQIKAFAGGEGYRLKVNPKDNTITIKKLKDSWDREEVTAIVKKALQVGFNDGSNDETSPSYLNWDKWIEENL